MVQLDCMVMGKERDPLRHSEFEHFMHFPLGFTDIPEPIESLREDTPVTGITDTQSDQRNRMHELLASNHREATQRALFRMSYRTVKELWHTVVRTHEQMHHLTHERAGEELLAATGHTDHHAFLCAIAENITQYLFESGSQQIDVLQLACEESAAQHLSNFYTFESICVESTDANPFRRGVAKISYQTTKSLWNSFLQQESVRKNMPLNIVRANYLLDFGIDNEKTFLGNMGEAVSQTLLSKADPHIDIAMLQLACESVAADRLKKFCESHVLAVDFSPGQRVSVHQKGEKRTLQ